MNKIATLKQFFQAFILRPVLILGLVGLPILSQATTVLRVSMEELAQKSELIFEGKVLSVDAHKSQNNMIHTRVTFEVADVVKGSYGKSRITLSFLGGTYQGKNLTVGGMYLPRQNEEGMYFVESVSNRQVHPFYGWSQGHYLLKKDPDGVKRLASFNGRPIRSIQYAQSTKKSQREFSHGIAQGVQLSSSNDMGSAITADDFKSSLKKLLER